MANWTSVALSADGSTLVASAPRISFFHGNSTAVGIYISTNFGVNWTTSTNTANWQYVACSADGQKLATAWNFGGLGQIFISTDAGASWNQVLSTPLAEWHSLACSTDARVLIGGFDGAVYVSTNSGSTWSNSPVGDRVACSADGSRLFAGGAGFLYRSTNSGTTWQLLSSAPPVTWSAIACSANGTNLIGAASGSGGLVYTSTNAGVTWITNSLPGAPWTAVAASADGTRLIAANEPPGSLYTSTDSGNTWVSNTVAKLIWDAVALSADGGRRTAGVFGGSSIGPATGVYTSASTPSPQLNIKPASDQVFLSWMVPSTNFVLEQNADLTTSNWTSVANAPVLNLTNLQDEITLPATNDATFFRLRTP